MVFSSSVFLFVFLPLTIAVYFAVPARFAKNVVLLLASLVFYAWGEPAYIALMVVSIVGNYIFGMLIGRARERDLPSRARAALVADVVLNLALLGFFKYEGFVAENVNALVGAQVVPNLHLPLPIGISFYTLQALSYIVDVYRGQVAPQRNIVFLGMYIACFPQLVAGPIVRYSTIEDQILNRRESLSGFVDGLRLFVVGLAKKVLLANVVAILADQILSTPGNVVGAIGVWGGLVAFTFQILFDFSGYSDMAIGLGKMFGFTYLRNFNYPYLSTSATEFWRRWHISLGSFFRDYIYIPMGGNRCSRARWVFNIFCVWALTGLWHGAAWNFVIWGLYYGCLLVAEKLVLSKVLAKLPAFVRHLYGIVTFLFGWLLFWVGSLDQLGTYLAAMFGAYGAYGMTNAQWLGVWAYLPVFLVCAVASTPVVPWLRRKLVAWGAGEPDTGDFMRDDIANVKSTSSVGLCAFDVPQAAKGGRRAVLVALGFAVDVALLCMFVLSVASVISGSFNPFIYFRF